MRPSSLFGVLAVAVHALPISPFNDSLLDSLHDLIFKSVGGLLTFPFGPYKYGAASCYSCNFDSKFCVTQCVPECVGGAEACSNCLSSCYRENGCFSGLRNGENGSKAANEPKPNPPSPEEPAKGPTPDEPAPDASA